MAGVIADACTLSRSLARSLVHPREDTTGVTRQTDYQNRHRDLNEEHHPLLISVCLSFRFPLTSPCRPPPSALRSAKNSLPSFRKCYPPSAAAQLRACRVRVPLLLFLAPAGRPGQRCFAEVLSQVILVWLYCGGSVACPSVLPSARAS